LRLSRPRAASRSTASSGYRPADAGAASNEMNQVAPRRRFRAYILKYSQRCDERLRASSKKICVLNDRLTAGFYTGSMEGSSIALLDWTPLPRKSVGVFERTWQSCLLHIVLCTTSPFRVPPYITTHNGLATVILSYGYIRAYFGRLSALFWFNHCISGQENISRQPNPTLETAERRSAIIMSTPECC
jgi:hypothetical protein